MANCSDFISLYIFYSFASLDMIQQNVLTAADLSDSQMGLRSSITSLQLCAGVIIIDSSFKSITLVAASTGRHRDLCVNGLKEV